MNQRILLSSQFSQVLNTKPNAAINGNKVIAGNYRRKSRVHGKEIWVSLMTLTRRK
jgi:hypothetical protein